MEQDRVRIRMQREARLVLQPDLAFLPPVQLGIRAGIHCWRFDQQDQPGLQHPEPDPNDPGRHLVLDRRRCRLASHEPARKRECDASLVRHPSDSPCHRGHRHVSRLGTPGRQKASEKTRKQNHLVK